MIARTTVLATPSLPLLVDARVFDAFEWQRSTHLEWRTPHAGLEINALDRDLPLRLAFVFREPWSVLPAELARLHAGRGYGLTDESALAPYAIDDATDLLFEHKRVATDTFWLAADNLNALFWGLHDWAHFHNHGPFTERAATEFQCDASALVWLWLNRDRVPLTESEWDELRAQIHRDHVKLSAEQPPEVPLDLAIFADRNRLISIADRLGATPSSQ